MAAAGATGWKRTGFLKGAGLPAPSGEHVVGCVDVMPLLPGEQEGLLFRFYYPTSANETAGYRYAAWLPDKAYAKGYLLFKKFPSILAGLFGGIFGSIAAQDIPALYGAPLKAISSPLPVVVYSHGVAGMRTVCSATCCELASHGYFVAAIEHRDASSCCCLTKCKPHPTSSSTGTEEYVDKWIQYQQPPSDDAETIAFRAQQLGVRRKEIVKTMDFIHQLNATGEMHNLLQSQFDCKQLKGQLDMDHVAIAGHSFGASTTVTGLADDKRFKVGVALDAYMIPVVEEVQVDQPLLFINTWTFQWPSNLIKAKKLVDSSTPSNGYPSKQMITLKGTNHEDQSDGGFVTRRSASLPDINLIHSSCMNLCLAFLRRHLWKDSTFPVKDLDEQATDSEGIVYHGTNVNI